MAINFNTEPYYDDYDATKDYYRVLFQPGYAVQARELTQLQTILQNQVGRFGDHIFKNGSQVIPGSVNVDNEIHFVKIKDAHNGVSVATYVRNFQDKIITGVTSGVKMRVIDTSACDCVITDKDIVTLYCKVESTDDLTGENKRLIPGEIVTAFEADNQIATNAKLTENQSGDISCTIRELGNSGETGTTYTNNPSSDILGFAYGVDVKEGIYYIDGIFVRNPEVHLYIGRFSNKPTTRVGFKIIEDIVTSEEDTSLLDNAQGTFNYAAPGAHRYKISTELIQLDINSTDNIKFIELLRVVDGRIQHKIEKATYSELEKTLARRTFDESGNYEVNKFKLGLREHLDNGTGNLGAYPAPPADANDRVEGQIYGDEDKFVCVIEPGKAYIQGYEVEAVSAQFIDIDKARENSITGDEGGHIVRVDDTSISTPVGNYVTVTNTYHYPNINQFEEVYLVSTLTPSSNAGAGPDAADIVGTARIKSYQLYGSTHSGSSTQFNVGLMDIQMYSGYSFAQHVKRISGKATAGNFTCDLIPKTTANGITEFLTGTASSSGTTITGVGTNFVDAGVVAGDVLYFGGTRIGTVATTPTDNGSLTLTASATTYTGKSPRIYRADLKESRFSDLIFPVGQQFIKTLRGWDSVSETDILKSTTIIVRRQFDPVTASSTSIQFSCDANEAFESELNLDNWVLIKNSTNLPESLTTSDITVSADKLSVTIDNVTSGVSYTLIATLRKTNAGAIEKKLSLTNTTQTITGKSSVTKAEITLSKCYGYKIDKVEMTPGNYSAFDVSKAKDITDRYELDDGQRSEYIGPAKLKLKAGYKKPSGAIKVSYSYFEPGGDGDNFFSVDSYTGVTYDEIPSFYVKDRATGKETAIDLSSALDYRPILNGDNTHYTELPMIGENAESPYAFYIGRQDKLVLDSVGRFNVIKGIPALLPQEPQDPPEGMVLASFYVPPYTKSINDVKVYQRDNRRYTMRDIGKLDRRITKLEYYVALSLLETETATLDIKDPETGLDKFKNGFIVDQFTGHGIGDVQNSEYRIAVDSENRQLRPMHFTTAMEIVEDLDSGDARAATDYVKNGDIITMPYTEEDFVYNVNASRTIDVNPYKIGAFKGEIQLIPEGDNWKDTDRRPDLQVTDDNNYDAIKFMADSLGVTGTKWDEWETNWTGKKTTTETWQTGDPSQRRQIVTGYEKTTTTYTGTKEREGIKTTLQSSVNSQDYGDRVVDIAFAPYMRARPVVFLAKNLKANTRFYPFFDGTAVGDYCQPADIFRVTRASGSSKMSFSQLDLNVNALADDPSRSIDGEIAPAFVNGDVLTNSDHTATNITAINGGSAFAGGASFPVTVASVSNIKPGHHVQLYNLNFHKARTRKTLWENQRNSTIPASTGIADVTKTSKKLNLQTFVVLAVNTSTKVLTLGNIDGSNVKSFTAYDTSGYTGTNRGKLLRLTASCVVVYDGYVVSTDSNGILEQDIAVMNVRGGFAVGETLTGSVKIGSSSNYNTVVLNQINGSDSTTAAPTMKVVGDKLRADIDGAVVGLFNIPNNDTLAFRTGEREFKLTDNVANSDADFDSKGSITYYSQGMTLSKERTIVNSRTAEFVQDRLYQELPVRRTTTSTRQTYSYYTGHDPIAQTFTVQSTGGCFVTSVDVFFSETGARPVTVELRTTNNGVPSTKVIPFSQVTKTIQEISTSDDGSLPTRFDFKAPIYLQDTETYALIVKTDEPGCQLFISELGKTDIITGNIISSQPLTGSIYLSQNSKEFEINPLLDMKFTLRKAKFDISSGVDVLLRANPPKTYRLPNNPFEITPDTNLVRVKAPNHGFVAGEEVSMRGVVDANYGTADADTGIPAELFNTAHTISSQGLDKDSFIIELDIEDDDGNSTLDDCTTADFVKGEYGGNTVKISRGLNLDAFFMKTQDLSFADTNIQYYLDAENAAGNFTGYTPFVPNSNYFFTERKHICSYDNQQVISESPLQKKSSLRFKAVLTSTNANVSPVIDLQQLSAYAISNLVNNQTAATVNVDEIDTRILLDTLNTADVRSTSLNGSITSSTGSPTVTGVSTSFTTEIKAGDKLYNSSATLIGTVSSVASNTSLTLTANAAIAVSSGSSYIIESPPNLSFTNSGDYGIISTNIDVADNLLANAEVGKYLNIVNAHANVNGTDYVIHRVETITDTNTLAANPELDRINIYVKPAFTGSATINMITDTNFRIEMMDKFVEDFAPKGTHNYANYITRTLSLAEPAEAIKIIFDASIIDQTSISLYYRAWDGPVDANVDLVWTDVGFVNSINNSEGSFSERELDLEGLSAFKNLQLKIVMKSQNPAKVPLVKNLRMIAHS